VNSPQVAHCVFCPRRRAAARARGEEAPVASHAEGRVRSKGALLLLRRTDNVLWRGVLGCDHSREAEPVEQRRDERVGPDDRAEHLHRKKVCLVEVVEEQVGVERRLCHHRLAVARPQPCRDLRAPCLQLDLVLPQQGWRERGVCLRRNRHLDELFELDGRVVREDLADKLCKDAVQRQLRRDRGFVERDLQERHAVERSHRCSAGWVPLQPIAQSCSSASDGGL